MADEVPAVENKVSKSDHEGGGGDQAAVAENSANNSSNMPLQQQGVAGGSGNKYEPLRSLSDLRTTHDLTEDGVRHILRRYTRDFALEIVSMGNLEDMSGLNDAFNSCICSMDVTARLSGADKDQEFHFVIKSPPQSSFIRQMHKFSRPFFNEVKLIFESVTSMSNF